MTATNFVSQQRSSWSQALVCVLRFVQDAMQVSIGLARADYEKLVNDVPAGSRAYGVLHRLPQQRDRWTDEKPFSMCVIVECERADEALALLEAARKHCPGAIPHILCALRESGVLR